LTKANGGNDNFYVEVRPEGAGKGWFPSIRLGPRKSALGNLPEDVLAGNLMTQRSFSRNRGTNRV
jgi:hypothetical protein